MLDDFFDVEKGPHDTASKCLFEAFKIFLQSIGVEYSPAKTEGPSTKMIVLGLEIDTLAGTISVPPTRMEALHTLLPLWKNKFQATKNELQKLIGVLSFCSFGVAWGRTFLRRLIGLMSPLPRQTSVVQVDTYTKQDIDWWIKFSSQFNGTSLLISPSPRQLEDLGLTCHTDASGNSCAGVWGDKWFHYEFTDENKLSLPSIGHRELYAIICFCKTFELALRGKTILVYCDNESAVAAINNHRSRNDLMNSLIRELFSVAGMSSFQVLAKHLPGVLNTVADALSRPPIRHLAWTFRPTLELQPTAPILPILDW
jgi:hypothetical protein